MPSAAPDVNDLADATRSAPMGVWIASVEGNLLRANPLFCAMLGCEESWLVGRPLADLMAEDASAATAPLRALQATGELEDQRQLRRLDGALIDVKSTCAVVRGGEGQPLYVIGYVQSVREQPGDSYSRQEVEDIFAHAFATAPVGMALLDASFRFRRVNPALARIFALPADELVGRTYVEFLHADEQASAEAKLDQLDRREVTGGEQQRRIWDAAGRTRHLRMGGTRITTRGLDGYFGVFVDVTAEREAETEREHLQNQVLHSERLRTLGLIAGGVAQEVNNPAAIAIGGVDLARRHMAAIADAARLGDLATVRRHIDRLEASLRYCEDGTARLAKIARKLSVFSALRGGDVEQVDVNELARRAIELLQNDLRNCAELRIDLMPLPPLFAHPERLVQALTNLLVNACQAVDGVAAEHRITLSTRTIGDEIELRVADTGSGMSNAILDRIFEPFYTTRGRAEGSGLGLAIVFDVVRQHRGRIDVKSEPGHGSLFTISLPLQNGLGPAADPPNGIRRGPRVARARILVVDDEPSLLGILSAYLSTEHDVVTAGGGPEALAILGQDVKFDAVLCDLMMPGVDGIAVHRFLLEHAPSLAARTVFATGGAFTTRAAGYVARRRVPVLLKPFSAEEVRNAMATALLVPAPSVPEAPLLQPVD
ncbi:MAG: PAS domain S-box protein [Pseudomonadota bacterium]|nr:PAS domain S-box protein [Pseudomonadota bacterium]